MSSAAHDAHYADNLVQQTVDVVLNQQIARDTFRLRVDCPEMARTIVPGQFVMLRLDGCDDPLIGRPLALYDTIDGASGRPEYIDVVYLVKGKFTTRLQHVSAGQHIQVWGPLGNGFPAEPVSHLLMVAGGIGQTPFVALAREYLGQRRYGSVARSKRPLVERVTLLYGARTASYFAGVEDFEAVGVRVKLATDDGSRGRKGLVTDLLHDELASATDVGSCRVVCCGPEPMMAAVTKIAQRFAVSCQVSLETPMACGIGICFTCVAKIREGDHWDYRRTCVEGPVFDANQVVW